jgi:hypothetical protein
MLINAVAHTTMELTVAVATVAEETLRGPTNRLSPPSALPCVNDDFSLPTPEIRLLITIKLVRRLKLTQETRLMSVEDL